MAAKIERVDFVGLVRVKFNQTLDYRFLPGIEKFDNTFMDVQLQLSTKQRQVDGSNYNFTWVVTEINYSESSFDIQLNFDSPLKISTGNSRDILIVELKKPWMFRDRETG